MLSGIIAASAGAAIPLWRAEFGGDLQISWYFNLLFVGGLLGTFVGSRIRLRQPWLPLFIALEVFFRRASLQQHVLAVFNNPEVKTAVPVAVAVNERAGFGLSRRHTKAVQDIKEFIRIGIHGISLAERQYY